MPSFFDIPSSYPDHVIYRKILSNHQVRYPHYDPREDYLENWTYFASAIVRTDGSLDLVPFFEDSRIPLRKLPYGFFKRFLEIIPPSLGFDFVRTNKTIFNFFKNLRGIPTRSVQFQLEDFNFQDLAISEENGEISVIIQGDPYGFADFVETDILSEFRISGFLHVEADGYEDEAIMEILTKFPKTYPDLTYEGCDDLNLVLELVHEKLKYFKLKGFGESFDFDNFLQKTVNLQSLFVEIDVAEDFATDFIMDKLQNWKQEVRNLDNFYFGIADETNFRRFYFIDDEIKCFENDVPENFDFEDNSDED